MTAWLRFEREKAATLPCPDRDPVLGFAFRTAARWIAAGTWITRLSNPMLDSRTPESRMSDRICMRVYPTLNEIFIFTAYVP